MNYRLARKKLRLGLSEAAVMLNVTNRALWQFEHGARPWPEGLQRRYEQLIAAKAKAL